MSTSNPKKIYSLFFDKSIGREGVQLSLSKKNIVKTFGFAGLFVQGFNWEILKIPQDFCS